ncbi:uncharacterized protein [Nerophis lumbriciformis]|uniref:uncharacterized protein n=1 Tax=Nerophis lumbriciformis TaxID=546530 RepID=UPI002ADF83E0|nr:uncharacterized protein LOC133620284 [Nerophis lumbriciformis]
MCVSAMEATRLHRGSCEPATVKSSQEDELEDSSSQLQTTTRTPVPRGRTLPPGSDFSSKAVLCLIDAVGRRWGLYETRERSQLFQSVQEELAAKGHILPVEKIRRKWNNLIVTYKRVKDRSRETGHDKTSWEFFDLMDATLCDTVGSYISNKRGKGGGGAPKITPKLPTAIIRTNGSFSSMLIQAESEVKGQSPASSSSSNSDAMSATLRQTESVDLKPLLVVNSDIVTSSLHLTSTEPPPSCFTQTALPSLGSDMNMPRKARPYPTDVICFRRSFPEGHKANQEQTNACLYQEILKKREEQTQLDGVAQDRVQARERRRERREVRMAKSLCRISAALELLSSKQDTVIALLQRLADKK